MFYGEVLPSLGPDMYRKWLGSGGRLRITQSEKMEQLWRKLVLPDLPSNMLVYLEIYDTYPLYQPCVPLTKALALLSLDSHKWTDEDGEWEKDKGDGSL